MTTGCRTSARLKPFLLASMLVALALPGAAAQAEVAVGSSQLHFPSEVVLRPEVAPCELERADWNLNQTNAPFLKEPELSPRHVLCGVLQLGKDTNNAVALIWDQPKHKLWLDLNRNLDLTDDPTGVFSSTSKGYNQLFANVNLPLKTATGPHPATLDLRLSADAAGRWVRVRLTSRSLWQAKVTLDGADWQVAVLDELFGPQGPAAGKFLLLRPWAIRTNFVSLGDCRSGLVPFPDRLFWLGRAFHLERRFETGGEAPVCKLELTPQQPPLTELTLSGESLYHAVLCATNGYTALLREPPGTVQVPAGVYTVRAAWLKKGAAEAYRIDYKPLVVNAMTTTNLVLGGPLTNSVALERYGRRLLLNYQLKGADGGSYLLAQQDSRKPPEFTVYRGGKKVLSDKFQYG